MRPVLNSVLLYNKDGVPIPARDLMDKKTYDLDIEKFNANKPIYITEYFALTYISNFLALSATFSHVILWHGKDIYRRFKEAMKQMQQDDSDDIHNRLMSVYPDIPEWVYGVYLACCIAFMSFVVSNTAFTMPIWAVFLGVGVTSLAIIPLGTVEAISGKRIYLNVITQMTIGLLIPGQTISIMAYKSLGTNGALQAMTLISDLKLGHYMKVPPVAMVGAQLLGTFVGAFTTTFTCWFVMDHMNIGAGDWKATSYSIFYSAGAIWGAIGPRRFFGIGTPYETLLFGFLIGFLLPFLPWIANKVYPNKFWRYINVPLLLYTSGVGSYQSEIIVGFIVNVIFQLYLFRYQYDWWKKYTYVFSAAVSGATMVAILLIALLKNLNFNAPFWWGNPEGNLDYYCYDDPWRSTE
jgi:OPT family oligopeptide transporter